MVQFAKKTGDYAVLSRADICVIALTHTLQLEEDALVEKQARDVMPTLSSKAGAPSL